MAAEDCRSYCGSSSSVLFEDGASGVAGDEAAASLLFDLNVPDPYAAADEMDWRCDALLHLSLSSPWLTRVGLSFEHKPCALSSLPLLLSQPSFTTDRSHFAVDPPLQGTSGQEQPRPAARGPL